VDGALIKLLVSLNEVVRSKNSGSPHSEQFFDQRIEGVFQGGQVWLERLVLLPVVGFEHLQHHANVVGLFFDLTILAEGS